MPQATTLLAIAAALAWTASALRVDDVDCPATCQSDLDCSLNGQCNTQTGVCQCGPSWVGGCCQVLNLLPAQLGASGYRHANTSTWGGNIIKETNASGTTYHMWIAEMAPNGTASDSGSGSCGLTTWGSNSQITHVSSVGSMTGPYQRQEVAVGVWSHNPLVRQMPDGMFVMYHIGGGGTKPPGDGYCAANGTSPCGEQGFDQCNTPSDPCASAGTIPGYTCYSGYCAGDAEGDANCGNDLAEPSFNCNTYGSCALAAAAACANTTGCVSFGLSDNWGLGKAKLFSAGKTGLVPNSQWGMWVQNGHVTSTVGFDVDMYGRAKKMGTHPSYQSAAGSGKGQHARTINAEGSCMLELHVSNSTNGPWVPYTNATVSPCGGNNPAPWVHPNGTVFIVFTDENMGLWSAPSWRGPYNLVTSGACGGGEDPSLFIDLNGHFHCMFHRSPFSNPDIAIGHSYSIDGFTWYVNAGAAANSSIVYTGLAPSPSTPQVVVHGKRERPHPYFDENGNIAAFVSGVCINPQCNPLEGGSIVPGVDCSSGGQYYKCDANSPGPGWFDRTYTLVQAVNNQ